MSDRTCHLQVISGQKKKNIIHGTSLKNVFTRKIEIGTSQFLSFCNLIDTYVCTNSSAILKVIF